MNWVMTAFSADLPFKLIGIAFLPFWGLLGFMTYGSKTTALASACAVNAVAFLALLLNLYQEFILGRYWGNAIGVSTQLYYLPVVNVSYAVSSWTHRMAWTYAAGFILMFFAYFIGFLARKKREKHA